MEALLKNIVLDSLNQYIYPNAIFFAERLFTEFPSLVNLHTLANAYFVSGDVATAYRLLRHHHPFTQLASPQDPVNAAWKCSYLLGVCCAQAGQYQECESLMKELTPRDAGVLYWLGVCARRQSLAWASNCFVQSVQLNPFMFASYEQGMQYLAAFQQNPYETPLNSGFQTSSGLDDAPFTIANTLPPAPLQPSAAPATADVGPRTRISPVPSKRPASATAAPPGAPIASGVHARSVIPVDFDASKQVMSLLASFARAFCLLYSYRTADALKYLTSPQMPQRNSGWVIACTALAAFHGGNIGEAVTHFKRLRDIEPWRLNDPSLVYFSTALWHQKQEAALAQLAQTLIEAMPLSPITLSVAGNAYSLARDSKLAITMFQRAAQQDRFFAYAMVLRGHEHLVLDQVSEAEACFQEAIRCDSRLYNAYAGLGDLHFRQEQDDKARSYFDHAIHINPLPSVMNRHASTFQRAQASQEMLQQALGMYEAILSKNPKNFTALHSHAAILLRLNRNEAALQELEKMRVECPDEAMVFITLGKCLGRLDQPAKAVQAYHHAMDLDSRRTAYIKGCLDRLAAGNKNNGEEEDI